MPTMRKMTTDEVRALENKGKGQRKIIEEQYDGILADYSAGEYGEAMLDDNENRLTVRNRLKAAARRRGLGLDFRRTKEDLLRFQVVAAEIEPPAPPPPAKGGRGRKKKGA